MDKERICSGFIGAGKVGCSLGRIFCEKGLPVAGYVSSSPASAAEAASMTDSQPFDTLEELAAESHIIFITVPDGRIADVWQKLKYIPLAGKVVCHCSGSLSAGILEHAAEYGIGACSLHPLYAVSSRKNSWQGLSTAVFTLEGDTPAVHFLRAWLAPAGLHIQLLNGIDKTRYHAAAVFASNLVIGLAQEACDLLVECGFDEDTALQALVPLLSGNMACFTEQGARGALTGPVERNDAETVARHLEVLSDDMREVYRALSVRLLAIASQKYPERDMTELARLLQK